MKTNKYVPYKKTILLAIVCLFIGAGVVPSISSDVSVSRGTIYVDDDAYPGWYDATHVKTIQEGIDNATAGDTVYVFNGTYYEGVVVNKAIDLIGEDRNATKIIGYRENVIVIRADFVNVSGFTIRKTGDWIRYGILIENANYSNIDGNIIKLCRVNGGGINLENAHYNIITNNVLDNNWEGIRLFWCQNNLFFGNTIKNTDWYGLILNTAGGSPVNSNLFYHNNFINNNPNVQSGGTDNMWDNGYNCGGNYWDDYTGCDNNSDGIGDTPYIIPGDNNPDRYPLMALFPVEHDIAITSLVAPTHTFIEEPIWINATIYNQGKNQEYNILVNFSVDGIVVKNHTVSTLEKNQETIVSFNWTSPQGSFNIKVEVQPVPQENMTNNNWLTQILVTGPDAAIISVDKPSCFYVNETAEINTTVKNLGKYNISNSTLILSIDEMVVDTINISSLAVGETKYRTLNWTASENKWINFSLYLDVTDDSYLVNNYYNQTIYVMDENHTAYVDDDGGVSVITNIAEAIDIVCEGDTIYVYNGTYYGNLGICKTINLIGEGRNTTIIDGNGTGGTVVDVSANYVNINGFTITNGGTGIDTSYHQYPYRNISQCIIKNHSRGIDMTSSSNNNIIDVCFINNYYGIYSDNQIWRISNHNTISNCNFSDNKIGTYLTCWESMFSFTAEFQYNQIINCTFYNNSYYGMCIIGYSDYGYIGLKNNVFKGNTFKNHYYTGIKILYPSTNNTFYVNNFINNGRHVEAWDFQDNKWDNETLGNYWDDCTGVDNDGDGIGDTPYDVWGNYQDHYPLMHLFGPPYAEFEYDIENKTVEFNASISGDYDGYISLCEWDFGDGTPNVTGIVVNHTYATNSTYNVTLTVTDDDGKNDSTFKDILIGPDTYPPEISNVQSYPSMQEQGKYVNVSCTITDTISVNATMINITFPDSVTINVSMINIPGTDNYFYNSTYITPGTYDYFIWANDTSCNGNTSSVYSFEINNPPLADYIYSPVNPTTADTIVFSDNSSDVDGNVVNWTWDFGDGNISYLQNPTHSYGDDGTYNVTLTVVDNDGATNSTWQLITVVNAGPTADFTWTPQDPTTEDVIQFLDNSSDRGVVNWTWDFGDGNISYDQNPTHNYSDNRDYNVCLTVEDDDGATDTICKTVTVDNVGPVADFTWTPPNPTTEDVIQFLDNSSDRGVVNWTWNFGDGNISYLQNPTYNYSDNRDYNVCLTVEDDDGAIDTCCKTVTVLNIGPIANFTWSPSNPTTQDIIQFTDNSTDPGKGLVNWTWNFDDGNISYLQNPTHNYSDNRDYNVCLTVEDDDGAIDTCCKTVTVLNIGPTADFTWTPQDPTTEDVIQFLDNSSDRGVVNWTWNFDDGNISYLQNPTHQYSNPSMYTVCLTVTDDDNATDTTCKIINVTSAVEIIDVNQSIFNRGFPIRHAIDGDWAGAQNFTPTLNTLTSVEIYLRKFGTPEFNLTVELRENHPQGTLLDTVVFEPSEVASSWQWLNIDFDDVNIGAGSDVFIVLPPAPSGVTTSFGYEWGYAFGNQYDDGAFWFTRDGGGLWRDLPTMYEFVFRTYGYSL